MGDLGDRARLHRGGGRADAPPSARPPRHHGTARSPGNAGDRAHDRRHDLRGVRRPVEKKLSKISDVTAAVNYATATARVTAPSAVSVQALTAAIEAAGYSARDTSGPDTGEAGGRAGHRVPAPQADRGAHLLRPAHRSFPAAVAGAGRPVPRLAMGPRRVRGAGGAVGRVAVPPGRAEERPARRRLDGHPRLAGHHRGLRVVGLRDVRPRPRPVRRGGLVAAHARFRRRHLPGGRRLGDHVPAGRAAVRGAGPADRRGGHARAGGRRRQGRLRAGNGRDRAPDPGQPAAPG